MAKQPKYARISEFRGAQPEACAAPDCPDAGEYRAPRSRQNLREYIWLCLEHIREYNASWDYYAGMDAADIERHRRRDSTWRRPSWPFGTRGAGDPGADRMTFADPFGLFGGGKEPAEPAAAEISPAEARALALMELKAPVTAEQIRARYVELVKELHPDANGGDKHAEERLKLVNQAYTTLKSGDGAPSPTR